MAPIQFDSTDGRGDEEHLTQGGSKPGGKNGDERPGEVQMRRRENKGRETKMLIIFLFVSVSF